MKLFNTTRIEIKTTEVKGFPAVICIATFIAGFVLLFQNLQQALIMFLISLGIYIGFSKPKEETALQAHYLKLRASLMKKANKVKKQKEETYIEEGSFIKWMNKNEYYLVISLIGIMILFIPNLYKIILAILWASLLMVIPIYFINYMLIKSDKLEKDEKRGKK